MHNKKLKEKAQIHIYTKTISKLTFFNGVVTLLDFLLAVFDCSFTARYSKKTLRESNNTLEHFCKIKEYIHVVSIHTYLSEVNKLLFSLYTKHKCKKLSCLLTFLWGKKLFLSLGEAKIFRAEK